MSKLSDTLRELDKDMSVADADYASSHLINLFKIFKDIEKRQAHKNSNEQTNDNISNQD